MISARSTARASQPPRMPVTAPRLPQDAPGVPGNGKSKAISEIIHGNPAKAIELLPVAIPYDGGAYFGVR